MKPNYVWVVEIYSVKRKRYVPCQECCLTKADAEEAMEDWKFNNTYDEFRVWKYVAEEPKR